MAIAISRTPTLRHKEAEEFRKTANSNRRRRAPKKEVASAVKTFVSVLKKQEKSFLL